MITAEKWSLNVYDRDSNLAIDPDGLLCQSRDPQKWNGARCNRGVFGKGNYALLRPKDDRGKSLIELMQFFLPSPSIPFNKNLALSLFTDVLILFSSFQNKESLSSSTDLLSAALK